MEIKEIHTMTGLELYEMVENIKFSNKPYEIKKEEMQVIANEINKRSSVVAKKYNKKHYPVSVAKLLR